MNTIYQLQITQEERVVLQVALKHIIKMLRAEYPWDHDASTLERILLRIRDLQVDTPTCR